MTSFAASTIWHSHRRDRDMRLRRYFARPLRQVAERSVHATHIVGVSPQVRTGDQHAAPRCAPGDLAGRLAHRDL